MQLQFNLYEAFFNLNPSSNNYIRYLQMKTLISKIRSIFQQNVRSETPSLKSLIEEKGVHELSNFSCFLCSIVSYWKSCTLTRCSKGWIMSEKCQRLKKIFLITLLNYSIQYMTLTKCQFSFFFFASTGLIRV